MFYFTKRLNVDGIVFFFGGGGGGGGGGGVNVILIFGKLIIQV